MKFVRGWVFVVSLSLVMCAGLAQGETYRPYTQPAPEILFHWTTQSGLMKMVSNNPNPNLAPLGVIGPETIVGHNFPDFVGKRGLFTWINPVTANSGLTEVYGLPENGYPPRLMALKPKRNSRILEIETHDDAIIRKEIPGLENYDLILNKCYHRDKVLYQEWIVLNPNAVGEFTADPEILKPYVKAELKKLENPDFRYPPEQLFDKPFEPYHNTMLWIQIGKWLIDGGGASGIPESVRVKPGHWNSEPRAFPCDGVKQVSDWAS